MRETMPVNPEELYEPTPPSAPCSLGAALKSAASESLGTVANTPGFAQIKADLDDVVQKYGIPLDAKRMSGEDARRFTDVLLPMILMARTYTELAGDFVRLARLESASQLMLAARQQNSGATARISSDEIAAASVIDVIDREIPAPAGTSREMSVE
jgi:hypothetical protein